MTDRNGELVVFAMLKQAGRQADNHDNNKNCQITIGN